MANIIGEPFEQYVSDQIISRQKVYGKKTNRTSSEISYLNSTNGWVKLASGVTIDKQRLALLKKNNNQMLSNISTGKQLAQNYVLFNGLSSYDDRGKVKNFAGVGNKGKVAYGLDGTDFGYSPMPGIISVDIKDLNRGSIKKATIDIKVFNRNQLEIIDCLYMRLGYTVLLEWGHSQYWDGTKLLKQPASLVDKYFFKDKYSKSDYTKFIPLIKEHRKRTKGNYDALFATVSNFSWTFESDGSYNCKIELISLGDIIESLGISISTNSNDNENKLRQAQLAAATFVKNKVTQEQFYTSLYPGLEKSIEDYFNFNKDKLLNGELGIRKFTSAVRNIDVEYYDNGVRIENINGGFTYPETPPITDEELKKTQELKESNIRSVFGTNRANKVMGDYFYSKILSYFSNLRKDKKYANMTINGPNQTVKLELEDIPDNGVIPKYNYSHKDPSTGKDVKVKDTVQGGYTIDWLGGNIYLDGMDAGGFWDRDPDQALIARNPMGFVNFARSTARGFIKSPLVEGADESYFFSRLQNNILIAVLGGDPSLSDFKTYIFELFESRNLTGGEDDPQFKEQVEAEKAMEDNPNEGEKQVAEFKKRMKERSLRGNFFKYFYDIKNLFTPKAIISQKEKETKSWYQTKNYDQVSFPSLEESGGQIKCTFDSQEIVGYRINPLQNKELADRWNKDVGWPLYLPGKQNPDFYFAYDKNLKFLNVTERNSDGSAKAIGGTDFFKLNLSPIDKSYYMSFEMLLGFLRDKNISTIDSDGSPPMINVQVSDQYYLCYAIDNHISVDPKRVIIANENFITSPDTSPKRIFSGLRPFIHKKGNNTYGRLPNIYLNCNRIEDLLTELADKRGEVKIYDFLTKICDDVNECLGGVNNLEVTVTSENSINIIDQTPIPGIRDIIPEKFPKNQAILEVFGYQDNQASFVTNIGLQTKISKEYATMITIGATSKGSIPGTEATAFSKWNIGIEDRFKNNLTPPDSAKSNSTSSIDQLREENKTVIENYYTNNLLEYQCLGFTAEDYKDQKSNTYLNFNDEFIKNNQKITQEYYKYAQADVTLSEDPEDKGITESSIGFIPFNLSVDMVGLSGLKIYNRLKVNTSFLPSNYDETLDFIITGVNHKITNNEWTTSLSTLATSKSVMAK